MFLLSKALLASVSNAKHSKCNKTAGRSLSMRPDKEASHASRICFCTWMLINRHLLQLTGRCASSSVSACRHFSRLPDFMRNSTCWATCGFVDKSSVISRITRAWDFSANMEPMRFTSSTAALALFSINLRLGAILLK